jgi:uncharacterized protein YggE
MHRIALLTAVLLAAAAVAPAQTTPPPTNTITASGEATRNVRPDMAQLNIGVVTQAATAQAAADQNAATTQAVIDALQRVLGADGTIQTLYYSIGPRYRIVNNQQTLDGYTVTNTLQVKTNNIAKVGPLIDAGNAAGANSVSGPYYGLQNPDPEVQQALTAAAKEALAHAAAIAAGVGGRVGAVISAHEGSTVRPIDMSDRGLTTAAATPIQTGTVAVSASVTVTVSLLQ